MGCRIIKGVQKVESTKIENLIIESLKEMSELVKNETCNSRIIMPHYRAKEDNDNTIRYSEQELKQIFLHTVETKSKMYYSVETPSEYVYSIKNSKVPEIKRLKEKDDHYGSARIDTSIYSKPDSKNLFCHIEFKHGNPDVNEIAKDFLRLTHELGEADNSYFIHYVVRGSNKWKSETFPSLMDKYMKATKIVANEEKNLNKVWIYLMFVKIGKKKEVFVFKFNLEQLEKDFKRIQKYNEEEIRSLGWSIQL